LDHKRLVVSIIDLAIVLVHDTFSLIRYVWLVIPRRSKYHDLDILGSVTAPLVHNLLIIFRALTNDDGSRVTGVCEVNCVPSLVDSDDCTPAEAGIKPSLPFNLRLSLKEATYERLSYLFILQISSNCRIIILVAGRGLLLMPIKFALLLLILLGHVLLDELRDKVAIGTVAVRN